MADKLEGRYTIPEVPRKAWELGCTDLMKLQIILSTITLHEQDSHEIRPKKLGLLKGRSCLNSLISFSGQQTQLVNEGKAIEVDYIDFT